MLHRRIDRPASTITMAWTFIQYPVRPGAHWDAWTKRPTTQKKRYSMDDAKDGKSKALAAALSQIEKQFGKGSIMKMDDAAIRDIDIVSTGSPPPPPARGGE